MTKKRGIFLGDLHCGHMVGLTADNSLIKPLIKKGGEAFKSFDAEMMDNLKYGKLAKTRAECWGFFKTEIDKLKPIDFVVANGDMIDGDGKRSGGTELILSDRFAQCEMAKICLKYINAKEYQMTYGTPYHTGERENFEDIIAKDLGAKIGYNEFIDINGYMFDVKHKIGSSSVPYGGFTPLSKEKVWNALWAEHGEKPTADFIIRSHIHRYFEVKDSLFTGIILPALQGMGSKYGSGQCSGIVDFGFVCIDFEKGERPKCHEHLARIKAQEVTISRL